jgi:hypothetical protein
MSSFDNVKGFGFVEGGASGIDLRHMRFFISPNKLASNSHDPVRLLPLEHNSPSVVLLS